MHSYTKPLNIKKQETLFIELIKQAKIKINDIPKINKRILKGNDNIAPVLYYGKWANKNIDYI